MSFFSVFSRSKIGRHIFVSRMNWTRTQFTFDNANPHGKSKFFRVIGQYPCGERKRGD